MAVIAVVGAGAVGCFYGAQLRLAGHEVRLVLRRDLDRVRREGLRLRQRPTDQVRETKREAVDFPPGHFLVCGNAQEAAAPGPVDWVLVALKTTAQAAAPGLIEPLARSGAGVVALCNGLGVEERLAAALPGSPIFGMLCFICVNRLDDGTIDHQAHGRVGLGHLGDDRQALAPLQAMLAGAGIACDAPPSLLEARWRKLVWNLAFNGLAVAAGGRGVDTAAVLADPHLRDRAEVVMREACLVANADLAAAGRPERLDTQAWVAEQFVRTAVMGPYLPSTLLDWRSGRLAEFEALFAEPVHRARRLGVPAPALERLAKDVEGRLAEVPAPAGC